MILSVENIYFNYPQKKDLSFNLKDISIVVNKNDFISVLGPNGSGKTTLIKILIQLLFASKGNLYLGEKKYKDIPLKDFYKVISYVPQSFSCVFPYSVFEIILMGRTPYFNSFGYENKTDIQKVNEVIEKLEIEHIKNKSINEISGGELQRVIIARSIAQDTNIIILDEPNSHLDLKHQIFIFDLLSELQKNGKTIISISHDLNLSLKYSKRILYMKEGRIMFDGTTQEATNKKMISDVFDISCEMLTSKFETIF